MGRVIVFREYKDNLLIGDNGQIVKLNPNDRRISRAIHMGWYSSNGLQTNLNKWVGE